MALFKIHKGDSANLDAQSRVEGYCWFTPDTGHFFIDTADARIPINATMYGVCNTAAATVAKTVDITGFRLYTGARVTVKFTYASGVANSTLNVNGTGAKKMVRYGTTAIGNSSTLGWAAGAIQTFTYDGTSWVADYWHNSTYTNVALGQGYATCSTAAATAAKTAALSSYSLTTGGIVAVKFTYAVPANATLNINSKGAKNIYYRGARISAGIIDAGDTAIFMYDGTQYQFLAKDYNSATTTTAGLMSAADKAKLDGIASGATANTGDITGVTAGNGLTGGGSSGSVTLNVGEGTGITVAADTVSAKLRSTTALTIDSVAATTTTGRVYPVAVDKTGYLAVNVPWTDTDTKYTLPTASSSTLGGVKIGSNINISSGKISVPVADGSTAGVTIVYPAASCTSFSSDSGTVTPLAVQKGAKMFAITRPASSTVDAITRYSNTTGDVKDSKIIIEDVTNSKDSSKKAQVIAIPAEGDKKMVYGYCTDQVDGTSFIGGIFDASATSYPYSEGLAIGGTSGNLLWKSKRVLTADDLYTLPTAGSTLGGVKTTSTVTSTSGLTACPIISGVVYYKNTTYSAATTSAAGLMSKDDKAKLDGIAAGANNYTYTLPKATSSTLGGVKIGSNITVSSGTISLTKDNVTAALGYTPPTTNTTYTVATQSANGLMSKDDKFKLDNTNVAYGTCDTAAATAAKVVALSGNTQWKLTNGAIIMVKFTNTNSASSVTLNVNSTGAYPIWYSNAAYTGSGTAYTGYAGRTITYMFNGTHWVWVSGSYDANTQSNTNSTNTSDKIYLIGATSQGSSKTTYSHDTAYVGTDGHVYSNSKQVVNLSDTQALTNKTYNGYTLAAACAKGVATSVASGNTNLVTSGAVYTAIQNSVTSVNGQTGAVKLKFIYGNANYTLRLNDNATDRTGALAVKDANDKNIWILLNTTTAGVLQYQWYDSNGTWINQANLLHTKNYADYCAPISHTHDQYLPLTGGTVSGEVNSSANVATSSAAFRNIKVLAPGTEVVAGTTAIPTGEIWVRYEE